MLKSNSFPEWLNPLLKLFPIGLQTTVSKQHSNHVYLTPFTNLVCTNNKEDAQYFICNVFGVPGALTTKRFFEERKKCFCFR